MARAPVRQIRRCAARASGPGSGRDTNPLAAGME